MFYSNKFYVLADDKEDVVIQFVQERPYISEEGKMCQDVPGIERVVLSAKNATILAERIKELLAHISKSEEAKNDKA